MTGVPQTLDRRAIAARIPHQGPMCLLDGLLGWTADHIRCRVDRHADPRHPLRSAAGLLAPVAIEYAAQAMALHGSLCAAPGSLPSPGYLASARSVRLLAARLDDAPGPLELTATRLAGDGGQALYTFTLHDASGRLLADGRAAAVLNSPLPAHRPVP